MKSKHFPIALLLLFFSQIISAQDVTQWRGEDRKGIYPDNNLADQWPNEGPELVLEINDIGNGYGSPVIVNDIIYIMGEVDENGYLFAFNKTGELLWKSSYGKEWIKTYRGSRSSPTVVDQYIYTCSGLGELSCFKLESGEKIWSKDLIKDFDGEYTNHGHSESPLVYKDMVYLVPGGKNYNVVALNRFSGDIIWKSAGTKERPGYNTPGIIILENRAILVTFSAYHLLGFDAKSGELLWTHEQTNVEESERRPGMGDTHSNTVFYENGFIYYFAGDGNGAVKLKLSEDGSEIAEVWSNKKFDNYMGGPIKTGSYIFGGTTEKKDLRSLNSETGEYLDSLKLGSGTIISADNKLYYYSQKGNLNLVSSENGKLELKSSFRIDKGSKEHFAHPVIHKGLLYQRHGNILLLFNILKK